MVGATSSIWLGALHALLVGWNAGVLLYMSTSLWLTCRMTPADISERAEDIDESVGTVTAGSVLATLLAMVAVVLELAASRASALSAPLAGITVLASWSFIHVLFAHRYAHEMALRGGLVFPGDDDPDFRDFLYLAFTVGMTAQVSDVTTSSAAMRRLVLVHALLAFLFNAAVVAAAVNLAASLAL